MGVSEFGTRDRRVPLFLLNQLIRKLFLMLGQLGNEIDLNSLALEIHITMTNESSQLGMIMET
jgi:hypothetical protein